MEIPLKCLLDNAKPGVSLRDICGQYYTRLRKNRSYAVFKDESGQYWCDDVRNGLVTVKDSEAFFWSEIGPAFRSNISEILQLDNGIIALATQGEGVILVRGQEYLQINTEQGLSGDICNDMITDGENLWVATNRGVTSIKQISFENKSYQLDIYNHLDGLITNEIKALARLDGVLFLASPGGLIRFREKELSENSILPRIDITQFIINEKDTLVASGYQLRPNQNNIRIHFVGLSFRNLGNLVYKYKLDGVDEDWIKTTALETHYSKLPPGKYQFMVSAIGPQGIESQNIETLAFTIKPAFGQTFLFKLILALIGCIILLVLFYLLYTTLQRKQLERKVALQTRQLNQKVAALAELNEKLERSNKKLAEFAHVASHDLKSPLRNVASFVQLLKRRGKDRLNETDLEFIEFAVKGVNHMDKVINDLLTMSKVNQFDKKKESVDFGKVVSDIVGEMQLEISEQNAVVQLKNSLPTLHFSATNAKQLFQNLISNALKYQDKPQPRVEVGCQQQNGHYQFFVKDNGIGIEPEYQSKVFMMFQRLHTQSEFSGTGIGLSICKKIVENNKGIIWFESTPGEGTTFFFTLPKHVR